VRGETRWATPGHGVDSRRMSEGANAELIRKVFADANRVAEVGGFDALRDFFSEEIVWEAVEDAPDAGTYRGHEGIRGYLEDWLETVDGFHNELRGLTELGAGVVADVRFSGRIKGTDSEMTFDYSQASLIEDGKVAHIKEFREHDEAVAWVKDSERGATPRT
jgi:ketosteroid isomerase-like protein